jgi:hypothetical protein
MQSMRGVSVRIRMACSPLSAVLAVYPNFCAMFSSRRRWTGSSSTIKTHSFMT